MATMDCLPLPHTNLAPSRLCLGTGSFGSAIPRDTAWAILDAFADAGGTCVDTAHVYAAWLPQGAGASERTIGDWLKSRGLRRQFIVSTKGGHPDLPTMHISRLSPAEIAHDLAESLERLQADSIDLYWLHRDDPAVPVGEIMDALHAHLAAGRVRAIGASNWTPARLDAAAAYARARGLASFCASQIGWSLAQANPEMIGQNGMLYMDTGTLEYHRRSGLPVMAYSSQGQGFFSGKYARSLLTARGQATATEAMAHLYFSEANFARLERAQALAAQAGVTANQIALAYLLSQPFPVYPIVGCRTVEQVRASCAASGLQLDEGEVAWLEGNNP